MDRSIFFYAAVAVMSVLFFQHAALETRTSELAAAEEKVAGLEERLAYAEATIALLEARATTDAKIQTMTPNEVRQGLKKWVR